MDSFDLMKKACNNLSIEYNEGTHKLFTDYMNLLKEWNEKINLTAITEEEEIFKKHFIDSIKILKLQQIKNAKSIIDIGTGAGFPGIPLKIMLPDTKITLLDSLNKRVNFLQDVINRLDLKNIDAVHGRAEEFAKKSMFREKYDIVVSRAVANLPVLSELCIPYIRPGGYFIALKGPSAEDEVKEAEKAVKLLGAKVDRIEDVNIEETDLNHKIVIIKKIKYTNPEYPRQFAAINKKPL